MMDGLEQRIKKLEDELKTLKAKRITQVDIIPDSVKMRHIGEGVRFVRGGTASNLPDSGEEPMQGYAIYFDETNNKLYIWNRSTDAWKSVTLS